MTQKQFKIFLKIHWLKIVLFAIGALFFWILVYLLIVGLQSFGELESFYKKMTLASVPLQLYLAIITSFVFAGVYMAFNYWFMFGGGFMKIGQSKVKPEDVNIRWTDVVGMESLKKEVWEAINLIKDRARLKRVGGKIIKGILLMGPPGCGKTYLAKALATEAGLPFLSATGSEFVGIFIGVGSSRVKSIFKEARVLSEIHGGCVIFIDEIDSIGRPRVADMGFGGTTDHNATLNQLLTEMDGLGKKDDNIIVTAATNVNEDELDPALMRAGRFDRKITVVRPGLQDRKKLFEYYLNKTQHDSSIDASVLARRALSFSAADIADMVREASLISIRNKHDKVIYKDLSEAYDRVVFGMKSGIALSEKDKRWVAYHEAGHAIIAYLLHPTDDVIKATIIPRKGFLGFVGHRPAEEVNIHDKEHLLAEIKICVASYISENLIFGRTGSGVDADFGMALDIAHNMVWRWGMGDSGIIGNFHSLERRSMWGTTSQLWISEKTKETLDNDVQKILTSCLKDVENILSRERQLLEDFAQELLKKEELEYDEIVEIFKKHGKERPAFAVL